MRRTRRQRWKRGVRAAAARFWGVSVVGGGRVVFFLCAGRGGRVGVGFEVGDGWSALGCLASG